MSVDLVSPLGDRREHPVGCTRCLRRKTWNLSSVCDGCKNDQRERDRLDELEVHDGEEFAEGWRRADEIGSRR